MDVPLLLCGYANDRSSAEGYLRNLPEERRAVREALRGTSVELLEVPNATLGEMLDECQRHGHRLAVFHFGGHADGGSLFFERPSGEVAPAGALALADFLCTLPALKLVVLNGCCTQVQAEFLLARGIPAVIATSTAIRDDVATRLAARLYFALGRGLTIARAFQQATAAVRAELASPGSAGGSEALRSLYRDLAPATEPREDMLWRLHGAPTAVGRSILSEPAGVEASLEQPIREIRTEMLNAPDAPALHRLMDRVQALQESNRGSAELKTLARTLRKALHRWRRPVFYFLASATTLLLLALALGAIQRACAPEPSGSSTPLGVIYDQTAPGVQRTAALEEYVRRKRREGSFTPPGLDLHGLVLRGDVRLSNMDLTHLNLQGADFSGATMNGVDLSRSLLMGARLVGTNLIGAKLDEAALNGADLRGAWLGGIRTSAGTSFIHANLCGTWVPEEVRGLARFTTTNVNDTVCPDGTLQDSCEGHWDPPAGAVVRKSVQTGGGVTFTRWEIDDLERVCPPKVKR